MTVLQAQALVGVLTAAGFSNKVTVPGEPHGLTALEMAICVSGVESGWNSEAVAYDDQGFHCDSVGPFQLRGCRDSSAGGLCRGGCPYSYNLLKQWPYNAKHAYAESRGGIDWTPWCTAFGNPSADCGHHGPSYLQSPAAYYRNVPIARAWAKGSSTTPLPVTGGGTGSSTPPPSPRKLVGGESWAPLIASSARRIRQGADRAQGGVRRIRQVLSGWR